MLPQKIHYQKFSKFFFKLLPQKIRFQTPSLKKIHFPKWTCKAWKSKIFYTFLYKEAKFSKLKYFLIIILMDFFSFYNILFYTQPVYFFHLLRDFCGVHGHIVTFFSFSSLERFWHLSRDFFIFFLYFLDNILADKLL